MSRTKKPVGIIRRLLSTMGPGFITGASDDDPSGIATYTQTGARFGYDQLWMAPFSTPFMIAVQEMCGRIGLVTGTGLAGNIRRHYSKRLLSFAVGLLFLANTINIGADLGAMASAAQLLIGVRFEILLLVITALTLACEICITYRTYARYLKYLTFSLFTYILAAFVIRQPWAEIGYRMLVPHVRFTQGYLMNIVALLGTTISPYLYFWQAGEEVEEEVAQHKLKAMGMGKPVVTRRDIRAMRLDTVTGMIFSNVIMFFIMLTGASALGAHGIRSIETATDAAEALRPLAGDFAFVLFALGIIGTGLLAVPILAGSASYALAESFRWKEGLYLRFSQAHGFYGAICIATILGLTMNFIGIPPFTLLYYTAMLNGFAAPPLLVLVLLLSNNKRVMGQHTNGRLSNVLGITITIVMSACALLLAWSLAT